MRVPLLPVLIFLVIGLLVDWYIYARMRRVHLGRVWRVVYIIISAIVTLGLLYVAVAPKKGTGDAGLHMLMWTLYSYISVYVPKYIYALFALVQQALGRLFRRKLHGIGIAGVSVAGVLFVMMWWGALINRFNIDVNEVEVHIPDLPSQFDGYRIVQLSDIHAGTYGTDTTFLHDVVERVNALRPDVVLFTGDIVNRHSPELEPFTSTLGAIKAPDGVWSVMGNHDYGDYYRWPSPEAKQADIAHLHSLQESMGWRMLNNSHTVLRRGDSDSLVIIGVENIGDPPFTIYGNLGKAYPDVSDQAVKVLMSHNPMHWVDSIGEHPERNIALTLSGHTHAMQMEILGHSPAAFRYKTWGGLYHDSLGRKLYVNIGLGEVGFPARIGATPEITLITLRR